MYTNIQTEAIHLMNRILDYTDAVGVPRSKWVVGITDDDGPDGRVFGDHRVDPRMDKYIVLPVSDESASRLLESFLTDSELGGFGGASGGDTNGSFIYAYLKRPGTRP